jgi:hypothetical protein
MNFSEAIGSSAGTSSVSANITGIAVTNGSIISTSFTSATITGSALTTVSSNAGSNCFAQFVIYESIIAESIGDSDCYATINGGMFTARIITGKSKIQGLIIEKSRLRTSINHTTFIDEFI